MIPDWKKTDVLVADLLASRFPRLFRDLSGILQQHKVPLHVVEGTRDIWIRDYSPVQVTTDKFIQFCYRPDYLRGSHEDLITPPEILSRLKCLKTVIACPLVLDGGNIVASDRDAILTDKVLDENSSSNSRQLLNCLRTALGVKRVSLIPKEPGDILGHADGMVRFLNHSTLLANDYRTLNGRFGRKLEDRLRKTGFTVERFPYCPDYGSKGDIPSAIGNYINFLRVGQLVILPCFNLSTDATAESTLRRLLPSTHIFQLNCTELAHEGGVLNCVTSTILASSF